MGPPFTLSEPAFNYSRARGCVVSQVALDFHHGKDSVSQYGPTTVGRCRGMNLSVRLSKKSAVHLALSLTKGNMFGEGKGGSGGKAESDLER